MKLMILDGNSIINRAFYGVRLLTTREGLYTNAIFGFLNILEKLRNEEQPDALAVAFDLKASGSSLTKSIFARSSTIAIAAALWPPSSKC